MASVCFDWLSFALLFVGFSTPQYFNPIGHWRAATWSHDIANAEQVLASTGEACGRLATRVQHNFLGLYMIRIERRSVRVVVLSFVVKRGTWVHTWEQFQTLGKTSAAEQTWFEVFFWVRYIYGLQSDLGGSDTTSVTLSKQRSTGRRLCGEGMCIYRKHC